MDSPDVIEEINPIFNEVPMFRISLKHLQVIFSYLQNQARLLILRAPLNLKNENEYFNPIKMS